MFSDAISSTSSRWRASSRPIAFAMSGSLFSSEAVKNGSFSAEVSLASIIFPTDA